MVEVAGLHLAFDKRPVLKDVHLSVPEGQIAVIMGSSGGGKTTLLKCVAGLLKPDAGSITVEGVDVVKKPEAAREHMGLVFQYAALFDYLDVTENILFGLRRRKRLTKKEERETLDRLLAAVGLAGNDKKMPDELSGGMRKRVGLARALCMEPQVLLYDEPTSGLDPVTAYSIDQLIVETRDRLGVTSLVVSHDVSSVLRVADKIIFLHQGEVLFDGPPADFRQASEGPIRELVEKARAESLARTLA